MHRPVVTITVTQPSCLSEGRGNVTAVQDLPRGAITCLGAGLMRGVLRGEPLAGDVLQ